MKDEIRKKWPEAKQELSDSFASGQPQHLWYKGDEIPFYVVSLKTTPTGSRVELNNEGFTAIIHTHNESDFVELTFYSKG